MEETTFGSKADAVPVMHPIPAVLDSKLSDFALGDSTEPNRAFEGSENQSGLEP
jgi:hypothetical protein